VTAFAMGSARSLIPVSYGLREDSGHEHAPHEPSGISLAVEEGAMLRKALTVTIDRPLGSKHPEWGWIYPVNYGYVAGVIGGDGEELDAYILGVDVPLETFTGRCIAVIERADDVEVKLVVVPDGLFLSDEEIGRATFFQEQFFASRIVR
jgi:inorganic pyrophosphatase